MTTLKSVLLASVLLLLSDATLAAPATQHGGPRQPSAHATDIRYGYVTSNLRANTKDGSGGPQSPPPEPSPGDESTQEWTECNGEGQCTRYHRTDRYQRQDAPITEGSNPSQGSLPYEWVPIEWGSSSCATANACLSVDFGLITR